MIGVHLAVQRKFFLLIGLFIAWVISMLSDISLRPFRNHYLGGISHIHQSKLRSESLTYMTLCQMLTKQKQCCRLAKWSKKIYAATNPHLKRNFYQTYNTIQKRFHHMGETVDNANLLRWNSIWKIVTNRQVWHIIILARDFSLPRRRCLPIRLYRIECSKNGYSTLQKRCDATKKTWGRPRWTTNTKALPNKTKNTEGNKAVPHARQSA